MYKEIDYRGGLFLLIRTIRTSNHEGGDMTKNIMSLLLIPFLVLGFSDLAFAVGSGGFENATFSAKSIAMGNAVVAQADEPAAISYNPAGITQLRGLQVQGDMALIGGITHYSSESEKNTNSTGTLSVIPTGYVTINPGDIFKDRVVLGVGSDSPFGLSKKYESTHPIGRYAGYHAAIKMFTIKPVIALKITDWLSVGGGPMYYRIFEDFGAQDYPNSLINPLLADGRIRMNMSGNRWGWHLGIFLKPHKKHQFGVYYRSRVNLHMKGKITVESSAFGGDFETGGNKKLNLPLNVTVGYAFKPSDRTTFEADFGYTRWATRARSYINYAPVGMLDNIILSALAITDKDWNDSIGIHLGANHRMTDKLLLLGGFHFYWTPVPNSKWIPAVPDNNRMGLSVGLQYNLSKNLEIGLSYLGILTFPRKVDNETGEVLGASLDGKYTTYLHDAIFTVTYKWEDIFDRFYKKTEGDVTAADAAVR